MATLEQEGVALLYRLADFDRVRTSRVRLSVGSLLHLLGKVDKWVEKHKAAAHEAVGGGPADGLRAALEKIRLIAAECVMHQGGWDESPQDSVVNAYDMYQLANAALSAPASIRDEAERRGPLPDGFVGSLPDASEGREVPAPAATSSEGVGMHVTLDDAADWMKTRNDLLKKAVVVLRAWHQAPDIGEDYPDEWDATDGFLDEVTDRMVIKVNMHDVRTVARQLSQRGRE